MIARYSVAKLKYVQVAARAPSSSLCIWPPARPTEVPAAYGVGAGESCHFPPSLGSRSTALAENGKTVRPRWGNRDGRRREAIDDEPMEARRVHRADDRG